MINEMQRFWNKINTRWLVVLGGMLYFSVLLFAYHAVLVNEFGYYLFYQFPISFWLLCSAFVYSWVPAIWMPVNFKRPSQIIYWILYLICYIPSLLVPVYSAISLNWGEILFLQSSLFIAFGILGIGYLLPLVNIPTINVSRKVFIYTLLIITISLTIIVYVEVGFSNVENKFTNIYDIRFDFRKKLEDSSVLIAYIVPWLGTAIYPFLISNGFINRNIFVIVIGFLGEIYIFSITGQKSVLFTPMLLFTVFVLLRAYRDVAGLVILFGTIVSVIIFSIYSNIIDSYRIFSLFVRRLIYTPGLATSLRFDFFYHRAKAKLGYSILEPFVTYEYKYNPPKLMGITYFNDPQVHVNANIFADAFSNFGILGILIISFILMLLFLLIDSLSLKKNFGLTILLLLIYGYLLANTGLQTTLVSHGMIWVYIIIFLMPKNRNKLKSI